MWHNLMMAFRNVLKGMSGGPTPAVTVDQPCTERRPLLLFVHICALVVIMGASLWLVFNPQWVQQFSHWGYASIFLIALISSATVILPVPGLVLVCALASLDPLLLGVVAGCGSGLGELTGYLVGRTGSGLMRNQGISNWLHNLTVRYTAPVLFVLAILPIAVFDFAGIIAGALQMPVFQFLGVVTSGKIIKYSLIAYGCAGSLPILQTWFSF